MSSELEKMKRDYEILREQFSKLTGENKRLRMQFSSTIKQVHELNEFLQLMLNLSPFGICIIQNNHYVFANRTFSDIFGFSLKQLRNLDPMEIVFEGDRDHVEKSVQSMLEDKRESFFMFRAMSSEEKIKWILGSVALVHMNEKEAILGNFVDLTEGRVMQLAYNDPLTGLPNRKLMMDRLEQAIVSAKRRKGRLALLFVDLDEFKEVNDNYGHDTGDQLLIEIANKLRDVVRRENDTIARIGGDEFLILLTDIRDKSHIETVAQLLFEKFSKPLLIGAQAVKIQVKFSVGIALYPEHGEISETLIHHADTAMYKVKKGQGKNQFHFFDP
ncbi:MAG: GGDEF domain-containing protein [Syntrophaceae bacterium]|nr:GGDEF domain-containing protein [Syntrophaceae bacterium]HOC59290.1 sensor domain-containing diguanylate cyclase [Smithellaceae bacterium]HQM46554.1 sensor domain-containing diguanylate cyclase [Smithellaceae bacterium]